MTASPPKDAPTVSEMTAWLRALCVPGYAVELRALDARVRTYGRPVTVSGFFDHDHLDRMAEAAADLSAISRGVYFTLNPLVPAMLARRCNRVAEADKGDLAHDHHVARRRWLLLDFDPVRISGISSSCDEKEAAYQAARRAWAELVAEGWPPPVVADSGNGYHLLVPVDWPADDGGAAERVLKSLADRFGTDTVEVDRAVFNAARICKLYGTTSRKGDDVPDRPHRPSRVLHLPGVRS